MQGLATYLTQSDFLPYERAAQCFAEVAGIARSPATLAAANTQASNRWQPIVAGIGAALVRAEVAPADENGMRVGGTLHWLHLRGTAELTADWIYPKRGQAALEAIGLPRQLNGILVHDHGSAHAVYGGLHALCNAHHPRAPIGIQETTAQGWPEPLMALLLAGKAEADGARTAGDASLSTERLAHYHAEYARILTAAAALNPANTQPTGKRGRIKQTPAHNLLRRLRKHQDATLCYLADLRAPFDNNQAEGDIRRPKCKQKISGGFRTREGAETFAIIRSYLSTLHKQSIHLYQSLVLTFQGRPPVPQLG